MPSTSCARKTCIRCISATSHVHAPDKSVKALALRFAAAVVVCLVFGLLLTFTVNVPMNETLAATAVPP
ncbi:putative membrane protein [Rhizobium mongolense]|uniref:Putative membrane protein n=1 Tax=Rhizobium mongolense TaxID=57676 RepID=A0A7W6RUK9_9HYPH|nr:putative membrane protein [Rhizobium mongolense]